MKQSFLYKFTHMSTSLNLSLVERTVPTVYIACPRMGRVRVPAWMCELLRRRRRPTSACQKVLNQLGAARRGGGGRGPERVAAAAPTAFLTSWSHHHHHFSRQRAFRRPSIAFLSSRPPSRPSRLFCHFRVLSNWAYWVSSSLQK